MKYISKKVCLLGDFAVGKTSLVRRFVYELFDEKYISTIGVKVSRKTVAIPTDDDIVELTLMLWDLAGGEEFNQVRASYLRGASGAILVCDVTRAETLGHLSEYVQDMATVCPGASFVLAANKSDLEGRQIAPERLQNFAGQIQAPWYQTSAKTGQGVADLFRDFGNILVSGPPRSSL